MTNKHHKIATLLRVAKKTLGGLLVLAIALALGLLAIGCFVAQPLVGSNHPSTEKVEPERLKAHVVMLSQTFLPRDWEHTANLDKCADYIGAQFTSAGAAAVEFQPFETRGKQYRNVIGRFGVGKGSKVIVGAHYDACGPKPGADDNASGVAALMELASLLGRNPPNREIELVAYVLEEPPFFRSPQMGSAVHAASIASKRKKIAGMLVLEMVGYFSTEKNSQLWPTFTINPFKNWSFQIPVAPLMRLCYPDRGDFIALVGDTGQGGWIRTIKQGMQGTTDLRVCSIRAPKLIPGIDWSDHLNYWNHGIKALMVTDLAFCRNQAYHTMSDTANRLDYVRMSKVVVGVFEAIRNAPQSRD